MAAFAPTPPSLKPVNGFMKTAADHDRIDPIIAYWLRLHAFQLGLKLDSKSEEGKRFLTSVIVYLEKEKQTRADNEAITNEIVAMAHMDNHAIKLFDKADGDDRSGNATKNTAKVFYTASQILDSMAVFGDINEEVAQKSKYAKWRAAYILKCIKNGDAPIPPESEDDVEPLDDPSSGFGGINLSGPGFPDTGNTSQPQMPIMPPPTSQMPTSNTQMSQNEINNLEEAKALNGVTINNDLMMKAQKCCKWAGSSLQYDDIKTAVKNLEDALNILKLGHE